jgi:uncharacterized protein
MDRAPWDNEFASFDAGCVLLTLYPLGRLRDEAAPGAPFPDFDWNGFAIGVNVRTAEAVDEAFGHALGARARAIADPVKREWGGYSGYFSDPEGNHGKSPGRLTCDGQSRRSTKGRWMGCS